ncbi:hypothetical protein CWI37_0018p0030 [Hamiltosporidium tvaerminnensis]|uniref:Uncharacterized protein n=1 Tax=Hamiltosporidium tvaerminnensis TaxID=1176355 RepID=A0A4Q9LC42_9MICR|nr:hypothetical protein CWI37_0018p0030 [Hamiltosporidium tvaerminnensis]
MIILNLSRYIIFLNVFNVILTTVSDSLEVLKKANIKEKPDQVLMKNITEDKEKDSTDSKIRENSEKENPSLDENNKKTVRLGNIFNLRRDSDSKNNKSSTLFDRKYSEINIADFNYPLLSLIPGINMLKDFIYKLLSNKSLEERNIFNIFVGMKMLESILVFSREIIFVLNPNHKIDIFNCDRRVKNILIEHKKIFFAILKILLAKNFCLSKEFFTNLRIIEIGCVCFHKNRQYWANEYHFYFLRALIDSIFLLDEELLNIVHCVFSDYVLNVSCHTGFVSLKRLNFFEIGKFKIAPQMAMKFIRYYLRMLNKKEFIMCRDLNEMIFRDIIGALTNEADIIEKNGSTQENEHMDLLFRCISTFHFIIKFGFNRDIHNHYHLKMLSEYIVLR